MLLYLAVGLFLGFWIGKLDAYRRFTKWMSHMPAEDRELMEELIHR